MNIEDLMLIEASHTVKDWHCMSLLNIYRMVCALQQRLRLEATIARRATIDTKDSVGGDE